MPTMPCTAAFTPEMMVPVFTAPSAVVPMLPIDPFTASMVLPIEPLMADVLLATFSTSAPVSAEPPICVMATEIVRVVLVSVGGFWPGGCFERGFTPLRRIGDNVVMS